MASRRARTRGDRGAWGSTQEVLPRCSRPSDAARCWSWDLHAKPQKGDLGDFDGGVGGVFPFGDH